VPAYPDSSDGLGAVTCRVQNGLPSVAPSIRRRQKTGKSLRSMPVLGLCSGWGDREARMGIQPCGFVCAA
jgi:hypothetical protein